MSARSRVTYANAAAVDGSNHEKPAIFNLQIFSPLHKYLNLSAE